MSPFLIELLYDLSLLLLFTSKSARSMDMFSWLYGFLFSLNLVIDLYFICLFASFFLCTDWSLFHSDFQRAGKSFPEVLKHTQYFVSFVGSVVIWGLPLICSGNFLPLSVVSPCHTFLFWGFLPRWAQCLGHWERALGPEPERQLGVWPGQVTSVTLIVPEFPIWSLGRRILPTSKGCFSN